MLRNRKADAQNQEASAYLMELRENVEESRLFWRESVDHDLHHEIVSGNFSLYEEAVAAYNAQCEKEGLSGLLRAAS